LSGGQREPSIGYPTGLHPEAVGTRCRGRLLSYEPMGTAAATVDISPRDGFRVIERDGRVLITPEKSKQLWAPGEYHLRSLLTDLAGTVLSSGFPKFFNYGEVPAIDAEFEAAMLAEGEISGVTFTEKLDGSLIVADWIDGRVHLRTRGNHDLGDFEQPVHGLIAARYPRLLTWLAAWPSFPERSMLFEYVSPDNQIVLRYEEPALRFLGDVDKATLSYRRWDWMERLVAEETGIEAPGSWRPPAGANSVTVAIAEVRGWMDREGVVAYWVNAAGDGRLLKIKASQYVRLHALRTNLTGSKAGRLAFLLDVRVRADVELRLMAIGIDHETAQFVAAELTGYFERVDVISRALPAWLDVVAQIASAVRPDKKAYVLAVKDRLAGTAVGIVPSETFFSAAMLAYDGKVDQIDQVQWAWVLEEPRASVAMMLKDREAYVTALLNAPAPDDG